MGLKYKLNTQSLEISIQQVLDRAMKGGSEKMRRVAVRIRDLAREFAPIDDGELRSAIDYTVLKDANRRNQFVVFVDPDVIAGRKGTKTVGDYAMLMERGLRPYGDGSAGSARHGGGGRFMKRAFEVGMGDLVQTVGLEVRRIVGGGTPLLSSENKLMTRADYEGDE